MKLIPLKREDGKEELDENGGIILIDKPLVNEENRLFFGINSIPSINELGSQILGPGELYDRNIKIVKGIIGILQKDNFCNEKNIN